MMPHVLIVNNDIALQTDVARMLQRAGYRTTVAGSASEALKAWDCEAFDLLVTDLSVPEMSAAELARRMRIDVRDLPVLYLSCDMDPLFVSRLAPWGGDALLQKPFTAIDLVEAVGVLLGSHRNCAA